MNKNLKKLCAYHGTKKSNVRLINENGFIPTEKGWLGKGSYFFEEDYELAIKWAKRKHSTIMVSFIKKEILVEEKKFFDITWPLSKNSKYLFEERERYVKEMERRGYKIEIDNKKRFEGELIDLVCKNKNYDVVRACTYTYQDYDEIYKLDSIFANGVEICVKDKSYLV